MRAPWHLWVIGIASLLWNAGGAFDYSMTQLGNAEYLAMLSEPQRAMLDAGPPWFNISWAVGVWGAVIGSLLLLLRMRYASLAFALSLIGLIASSIWSYGIAEPSAYEAMGNFGLIFSIVIAGVLVLLWLYARKMTVRGVLR